MIGISRRTSMMTVLAAASSSSVASTPSFAMDEENPSRSVLAFGAKGDGRTDDTDAFLRAIEAEQCVFVPPAPNGYRITRTLALNRPGQRIVGCGARSQLLFDGKSGLGANLLVTQHEDCAFVGLHLVPAKVAPNLFEGWAIAVAETQRAVVRDCLFSQLGRGGVLLLDSDDCRIQDNLFKDSLISGDGSERQSETGYDIFIAGGSSRNIVSHNQCLSGVGTAIGCQTVSRGKVQRANLIRGNVIRGYPAYGIMVYLSDTHDRVDPDGQIDAMTIEGNDIADISGAVLTDGRTRFYGCGIYLQTTNDIIVTGNRVVNTNSDRKFPFSGSAVPAAIGISGYGNAVVSGNLIDGCYYGIASIQTTARPRRGDATLIADNLIRNCDAAALWLADCVAATVHDNRLTASPAKGTHGILVRRFQSQWMNSFAIRGNIITDFAVGIEVAGENIPRAEIASNEIIGNEGNGIYSAAIVTLIHHNIVEGRFGISLNPQARTGICRDNVLRTDDLSIIDDGGSGVRVEDNVVPVGSTFATATAQALSPGPAPIVSPKRLFRKVETSPIERLENGYEGQSIVLIAEVAFSISHGESIALREDRNLRVEPGSAIALLRVGNRWRQVE
ncbi:right-handed parallel beta-helix repeat-containing protein [Allosphingosinicella flava]|uniref:Right-handed parallel beta-helix repeat-containing protein n=1 Tax=Allosphingosinicella flava TaxID=2771430 RepID=A0A7T2GIE4_9SPHN|nr:right-handed parallel beta-helix repeat-containing protein [Sphingosinicella flava]QPQ54425.1 right-handed parallel beta-helix repeat-containing protein [Sphingosinicella flava]